MVVVVVVVVVEEAEDIERGGEGVSRISSIILLKSDILKSLKRL